MSDLVITWRHVREAGFCLNYGARRWCKQHGVSFKRLMSEGIPASEVEHLDDALAKKVIEVARGK